MGLFDGGFIGVLDEIRTGFNCLVADIQYDAATRKVKKLGATEDDIMSLDQVYEKYCAPEVLGAKKEVSTEDKETAQAFNKAFATVEIATAGAGVIKDPSEENFRKFIQVLIKNEITPDNIATKCGQDTARMACIVFNKANAAGLNTNALWGDEMTKAGIQQPTMAFTMMPTVPVSPVAPV